jgi:hypothetical protein
METQASVPALSVVMVTPRRYDTCRKTISYLRAQTTREQLEIVIVAPTSQQLGMDASELDNFHSYRVVELGIITSNGHAIAAGIHAARSPIVVYGEEHSYPEPAWAERIIARHREPHAAVGYAMGNANPATLTGWAHLYGQFGPVVEPVVPGIATYLAGHHTSYKRTVLLEYGPDLAQMMDNECALHIDLRAQGHTLYLEDVVSNHVNLSQWRAYFQLDYWGQRGFAAARAKAGNWSLGRRLLFVAGAPLIPFVRLSRIIRDLKRTGRMGKLAPQIFFVIFPALVCGALGEAQGYLVGDAPETYADKLKIELDRYSYITEADAQALNAIN